MRGAARVPPAAAPTGAATTGANPVSVAAATKRYLRIARSFPPRPSNQTESPLAGGTAQHTRPHLDPGQTPRPGPALTLAAPLWQRARTWQRQRRTSRQTARHHPAQADTTSRQTTVAVARRDRPTPSQLRVLS